MGHPPQPFAWHTPVFLRIGYEFHGSWNGYTPESYVASFRKIMRALRTAGASNVAVIWCAESAALQADYMKYYPGDDRLAGNRLVRGEQFSRGSR